MHIQIERERLISVLDHVEGIVERRNTIPILSNVLIEARGDRVSVTATDLDIVASDSVGGVSVQQEGGTTVPASTFSALIGKMPGGSMIDLKIDGGRLVIKAGRVRFQIPILPVDDFPIGAAVGGQSFSLPIASILDAFKLVKDSMSTEESRYYLNGTYLAIEDGVMVAVSTDGHRLGIAKIADVDIGAPNAIVPRKAVSELIKIMPAFEGDADINLDARSIEFRMGDLTFRSKLIDGTFPDYTRVVPSGGGTTIEVDPSMLQQAIDRVTVIAQEKSSAVKIKVEKDKLTISASSPDYGTAQEELAATCDGDATVGYNGRYLKDILSGYSDAAAVTITFADSTAPALIRPVGTDVNRSVLMPMRI